MRFFRPLILLIIVPACVIDTVPMPEDKQPDEGRQNGDADGDTAGGENPSPDGISIGAIYYSGSPTWLVGAEHAVQGEGTVAIELVGQVGARVEVPSTAEGAFNALIQAGVGDTVSVSYEAAGVVLASTTVLLQQGSVAAFGASADMSNDAGGSGDPAAVVVSVSAANENGQVTVSAPADSLLPGIVVVIANSDNGDATTAAVQLDGSFSGQLLASPGNELVLFGVEPATSNGGGSPLTIVVP